MSQQTFIPLEEIRVARPCRANWDAMTGDDRARFCGTCHKNVYNLSQMTRSEAEALIRAKEGNLCVRFYQRPDGTMLTVDCPVGQAAARRPFWWLTACFALLAGSGAALANHQPVPAGQPLVQPPTGTAVVEKMRCMPLVGSLVNRFSPQPPAPLMIMGDIAPPTPPIMGKPAMPQPQPPTTGDSAPKA